MSITVTIPTLDTPLMQAAEAKQSRLVKPAGALGQLEALSVQLVGMAGRMDWRPERRAVIVFAADHGVMAHQVSTVPQALTAYMVGQFMAGKAAINVLARQMNARLRVVDAGVNADLSAYEGAAFVGAKIAPGTADFSQTTAMTPEQATQSLALGMQLAQAEADQGLDVLIVGEMGIGNTASASAIIAAITGAEIGEVTGRGTGIDDLTLARKVRLIEQALAQHAPADQDTLMKVGGFEIGAMAGAMLYAASQRIPVILDGVICTAAALIAQQVNPQVRDYLIAGHCSAEPGHSVALQYLGLRPLLSLEMRLGEGTGAVLALPLLDAAMRTLQEMGTLDVG